jgi:hypothetical protein
MNYILALIAIGVVVAVICGIVNLASGDRYANMTEAEFEAEAQRARALSGVLMSVQKIVNPTHKVEYSMQKDKQAEGDSSELGDSPEAGASSKRKS